MTQNNQLIQQLNYAREKLISALNKVDPQSAVNPGLTIKDMLAHISAWEEVCIDALRVLTAGEEPQVTVHQGIDAFNDQATVAYQEFSYEEVIQKLATNRQNFIALINKFPEAMLTKELNLPWGGAGTVRAIVKVLADHEKEHAEEIEALGR